MSAKLEDGNVRAALRILMLDDSPVIPSPQSLNAMLEKHPPSSAALTDLPVSDPQQCISVEEPEARQAVFSFSTGSAGGPRGLRPQHIHDLIMSCEAGTEFLGALTAFVNLVLAGRCPSDVAPVFFGGRLLALSEKSGGFRPIVVGITLRRLASKCANSFGINHLKAYFYPHQLGVGTPSGCEAAIHAARRYLESLSSDHVLVKLDFTNAFNSLHRREMLLSVYSKIPEEGPQQGDPVGPLLFSNTIHRTLSSLKSCLNL